MTLDKCRKWLMGIWGVGFIIPFLLILLQYGGGKYGGKIGEVLGWLTSLTLPTILLMIGVVISSAATEEAEQKKVTAHEIFVFRATVVVSLLYLIILNWVFFMEPYKDSKPQVLMRESKIFLAVIDSIVSLLIGYFFGKR